jgi:hypothetical protein
MEFVETTLRNARVSYEAHFCMSRERCIWLTGANQLISTYRDLKDFAKLDDSYRGWHAHHVFEAQDLDRIGASGKFPAYDGQLAVLLPEAAHINRINSILRNQAPKHAVLKRKEMLGAYRCAYELMGDYSGGGERNVINELIAIVETTLDLAGLRDTS